jgi:hypothetical protein
VDVAEWEEISECADCAEPVTERTQCFVFGDESILCPECAARRGGQYDATTDQWVVAPNLDGLPREE